MGETDKGENPCELNVNPSLTDDDERNVEGKDMDKANSEGSVKRAELSVPMGSLEPKVCVQQVIEEGIDEALDSDETSSTPHFGALCSQEDEGGNYTTLVSQENVIKFLDDTFRKRHVKSKITSKIYTISFKLQGV